LPERFLSETLEVASGRAAALPRERLEWMIDAYYEERGLDGEGIPKVETLSSLGLG